MSEADPNYLPNPQRRFVLGALAAAPLMPAVARFDAGGAAAAPVAETAVVAAPGELSIAAVIGQMNALNKTLMDKNLTHDALNAMAKQGYNQMRERIAQTTGYQWEAIRTFLGKISYVDNWFNKRSNELMGKGAFNREYIEYLATAITELNLLRRTHPEFVKACWQAQEILVHERAEMLADPAFAELDGTRWLTSDISPIDSDAGLSELLGNARKEVRRLVDKASKIPLTPEERVRALCSMYIGRQSKSFITDEGLMRQNTAWSILSDGKVGEHYLDHGLRVRCPNGNLASLSIEPLKYGETLSDDERARTKGEYDRAYKSWEQQRHQVNRAYFIRHPFDLAQLNDPHMRTTFRRYSFGLPLPTADEFMKSDPALFKGEHLGDPERRAMVAELRTGLEVVWKAKSVIDILARLSMSEPTAEAAAETSNVAVTPGRQLALEYLGTQELAGVLIDDATGRITIEDPKLAEAVEAQKVVLAAEDRNERQMAHTESLDTAPTL